MKKILIRTATFILVMFLSFGTGVFIAHFQLLKAKKSQTSLKSNDVSTPLPAKISASPEVENENLGVDLPPENPESENDNSSESDEVIFSFAVIGDTQSFKAGLPNSNFQKTVKSITFNNPDIKFAIALGDLVSSCDGGNDCEAKYNTWKSVVSPLVSKIYAVQGNHDRTNGNKSDNVWQKNFANLPGNGPAGFTRLAYSFDFENSHFVVLDSEKPEEGYINATQRDWLDKNLAVTAKDNIFIFYHEPAFQTSTAAKHGLDAHPKERDALWDIITKYHVKAVFSGHDHIYTRKNIRGVYQIVAGNIQSDNIDTPNPGAAEYSYNKSGYLIVAINGKKINLKFYSVDGNLINSFDF